MGRSRNNGGDDERLGSPAPAGFQESSKTIGGLEPMIPIDAQFDEDPSAQSYRATGDHMYARDDSDRLSDERDHQERDISDDERLELFRLSMFQNQLPSLPRIEGWHLCWLTTANPRDSIQGRLRLGYQLVKPEEVPGWEANTLTSGQYQGCVGVNEMVAAKLPLRLYEMYMTEAHHNQPLAEEGKLKSTLDAIREQAQGQKAPIVLEEGTAALGRQPRRPHFEEIHGTRRTDLTG